MPFCERIGDAVFGKDFGDALLIQLCVGIRDTDVAQLTGAAFDALPDEMRNLLHFVRSVPRFDEFNLFVEL